MGGLTAIALYRYRFRGKQAVSGMLFIVMMSPDIVMAVSLLALFMVVGISLGFWSLLLAHVTFCLPYVTVTIFSRLNGFDARMLEAAKDLGASEVTILRKIILPLALPAVVSGWLLSFTISLDDVVVSSFVSGVSYEILPLRIFSLVKTGVTPEVNALATIMIVLSLGLVILSQLNIDIKRFHKSLRSNKIRLDAQSRRFFIPALMQVVFYPSFTENKEK